MKSSSGKRKCACGCRQFATGGNGVTAWASIDCAIKIAEKRRTKAAAEKAKEERKSIKARKERLKGRRDYLKEAQAAWNSYVRMRDFGKPCASCGATPGQKFGGTMDCSHYRSVGAAPHLRFHLHNAAAACVKCNRHLGGNVVALRAGLVARIGAEKVEAVERNNAIRRFDIMYLQRIKKIFARRAAKIRKAIQS